MKHIETRDKKLLARQKRIWFAYIVSRWILLMFLITEATILLVKPSIEGVNLVSFHVASLIFLIIFVYTAGKIKHIESIKYYKSKYESQN